jgi:hypothetical protein
MHLIGCTISELDIPSKPVTKKHTGRVHIAWTGFELATLLAIGTDCIESYKSQLSCDHDGPKKGHSGLKLRVRIPFTRCVLDTTLCHKVCQWLATGQWFSLGTLVSTHNSPLCYSIVVLITHNSPLFYSIVVLITHNSPLCYSIVVLITKENYG